MTPVLETHAAAHGKVALAAAANTSMARAPGSPPATPASSRSRSTPRGAAAVIAFCVLSGALAAGCRHVAGRDVRFEPTPMPVVRTMLEMAAVESADVVYDLGSGDGRILITAAKEFGARGVGIEIDPSLVERARAAARDAGVADRVEFRQGDMYAADLTGATVVTLFLHPEPNLQLRPALRTQLRPGARVVSYIWDMGDWPADEVRRVGLRRRVFMWRIETPAPVTGTLRRGAAM
jgi:SAM-dependent methyltransferase